MKTIWIVFAFLVLNGRQFGSAFDPRNVSSDFLKSTLLKEISMWNKNDHDLKNNVDFDGDFDSGTDIYMRSVNQKCKLHLLSLFRHITHPNVLRLFDSWGKIPTGIFQGHLQSLGSYEECLQQNFYFGEKGGPFTTQYCLAKVPLLQFTLREIFPQKLLDFAQQTPIFQSNPTKSGLEFSLGVGICIPESCNPKIFEKLFKRILLGTDVKLKNCSVADKGYLTTMDYVGIVLAVILILLTVLSSVYDYFMRKNNKSPVAVLVAWSIQRNLKNLFDVTSPPNPYSIQCLNGIRVLSMFWILYGQEFLWSLQSSFLNLIHGWDLVQNTLAMIVLQAGQAAETFFYFSGLLISWIGLKELEKHGKKIFIRMYVHRILRLLPSIVIVVIFSMGLFKYFGSGPFWPLYEDMYMKDCEDEWWKTILCVQNYINPGKTCLPHTWYIAVDTQLYILSPLLLLGFFYFKKKFIPVIFLLISMSVAGIYITFFQFEISKINYTLDTNIERRSKVYVATHTRCISWMIGLTFGFVLRSLKGKDIKISSLLTLTLWLVSVGTLIAVVWGPQHETDFIYKATIAEAASYEAFSKIAWCFSLSLIILICQTGNGGFISNVLSHPGWRPLARMSFAVYLVHYVYQPMKYGNVKTDLHMSNNDLMLESWATFGPTFLFSVFLVVLVEYPIMELERILFRKRIRDEILETVVESKMM